MFEVVTAGNRHVFDSLECAIHLLAPMCEHCGCRIVGHGIEVREAWYWTMGDRGIEVGNGGEEGTAAGYFPPACVA